MKQNQNPPTLEQSLYIIPAFLTAQLDLAQIRVEQIVEFGKEIEAATEANRCVYERVASAYTRLRMEAPKVYAKNHPAMKLLIQCAPRAPENLRFRFTEFKVNWSKARRAKAGLPESAV